MSTRECLKLFVWYPALTDYSSGIIFAFAASVEDARRLVIAEDDGEQVAEEIKADPVCFENEVAYVLRGGA